MLYRGTLCPAFFTEYFYCESPMPRFILSLLMLPLLFWPALTPAGGETVYQEPEAFLEQSFPDGVPEPGVVWLRGELNTGVKDILGHRYPSLRIRYWRKGERSAWILEEIGKDLPITTGIRVNAGQIEALRVLIFRESRGWEVRHEFFTEQFDQAELVEGRRLDRNIDNISGATLSVRAVTKLARLALFLDQWVRQQGAD